MVQGWLRTQQNEGAAETSVIGYKYTYLGGEGVMLQTGGYGMCMKGLNTHVIMI